MLEITKQYRCELCKQIGMPGEMIGVRLESAFYQSQNEIHFCQQCFEAIRVRNVSIGTAETCPT